MVMVLPAIANEETTTERKKTIVKTYSVSEKNHLTIDNTFGQVKVDLWDKKEVKIEIYIKADANSDERSQCYLDGIQIVDKSVNDQIMVKTVMTTDDCASWANNKGNKIQIDYHVQMPKNMPLTVKNRFGNILIPTFRAALIIDAKHGNFTATDLHNSSNDIDLSFGEVAIESIENAKMNISYATLSLDKAKKIMLNQRFGNLNIGQIGNIDGTINYSGAKIGTITNSCKVRVDFGEGFKVTNLPTTLESIDIQANHSTVTLPTEAIDCSFDVTTTHGNFRYPSNRKVVFSQNDDETKNDRNQYVPRFKKQYIGKMGNGNGPRLKVVSNFSLINLR
jgi:hypothetical protein